MLDPKDLQTEAQRRNELIKLYSMAIEEKDIRLAFEILESIAWCSDD